MEGKEKSAENISGNGSRHGQTIRLACSKRRGGCRALVGVMLLMTLVNGAVRGETFEEKYLYEAGENDSKLSCRAISLLEVKRLLLERLGTYIESRSEVKNLALSRDEIVSLTAGIVKTEIVEEQWDGKTYRLLARIEADPGAVAASIEALRKDQEQRHEFANIGSDNEKALERITALKNELALMQENLIEVNRDYERSSKLVSAWDKAEEGLALIRRNQLREGIEALTRAIAIDQNYNFYFHRGRAYFELEQFSQAVDDFTRAIATTPEMKDAYFLRGRSLLRLGDKAKGRSDIEKAAGMGHGPAKRWLEEKGWIGRPFGSGWRSAG